MNRNIKNDIELEEIKLENEILKKKQGELTLRAHEIYKHYRDAETATADDVLMKEDITSSEVNYVLGQSTGFVDGFKSAINAIVSGLASEYRDIPMTESELYLLTELGAMRERAWLKDYKQKRIIEKSGWNVNFSARYPVWEKKNDDAKM